MSTKASIAGVPLFATHDVGWSHTSGAEPYQRLFQMPTADAKRLYDANEPVTLVIDIEGRPKKETQQLWVMSYQPSDHPDVSEILVSDRRVFWNRELVNRRYNVPRKSGDAKRLRTEGTPEALAQVKADITFAPFSLYPPENPIQPWTARQVLIDVLERVAKPYRIKAPTPRQVHVQNFALLDNGRAAIRRALDLVPGTTGFIDDDGTYVVFDELQGEERVLLEKGPPVKGGTLAGRVKLTNSRPSEVKVYFTREIEVRFDSHREGATTTTDGRDRDLENVLQLPENLQMGSTFKTMSSWVTFENYFQYVPRMNGLTLNHDLVQKAWRGRLLDKLARPQGSTRPDPLASRRVAAVMRHYRQTYRLVRRWRDRILHLRPYRVAVLDPETGTRAPAQAFCDYAIFPTLRGLAKSAADGHQALGWNIEGYAALLKDADVAPALVTVVDDDQAILHLDYRLDPDGTVAEVLPSAVHGHDGTEASLPTSDPRKWKKGERLFDQYIQLAPLHRIAIVVSCIPASPNDLRQLHSELVTPDQAAAKLGVPIGECRGPVWSIYVGPSTATARIAWEDGRSAEIEDMFGLTGDGRALEGGGLGIHQAQKAPLEPVNAKSVRDVALAAAAQLYAGLLDRVEGVHSVLFDPSMKPAGTGIGVTHALTPEGGAITAVNFSPQPVPVDLFSLLDAETRNAILRAVDL